MTSVKGYHDGDGHISTQVTPPIWSKDWERMRARTHDVSTAPLLVLYRLFNKVVVGLVIFGPDAKAIGRRQLGCVGQVQPSIDSCRE